MQLQPNEIVTSLKPSKILKILKDPVKSAKAVELVYTTDKEFEGITRKKYGKKFHYYLDGVRISDTE